MLAMVLELFKRGALKTGTRRWNKDEQKERENVKKLIRTDFRDTDVIRWLI